MNPVRTLRGFALPFLAMAPLASGCATPHLVWRPGSPEGSVVLGFRRNLRLEELIRRGDVSGLRKHMKDLKADPALVNFGVLSAASAGHVDALGFLAEKCGADPDPLILQRGFLNACGFGHIEVVRYLYERWKLSVSRSIECNGKRRTPLQVAAANQQIPIVEFLLLHSRERDHDLKVPDENGVRPMDSLERAGYRGYWVYLTTLPKDFPPK